MKLPPKKKTVEGKADKTWRTRLNEEPMVPKSKPQKRKRLDARRVFVFPD